MRASFRTIVCSAPWDRVDRPRRAHAGAPGPSESLAIRCSGVHAIGPQVSRAAGREAQLREWTPDDEHSRVDGVDHRDRGRLRARVRMGALQPPKATLTGPSRRALSTDALESTTTCPGEVGRPCGDDVIARVRSSRNARCRRASAGPAACSKACVIQRYPRYASASSRTRAARAGSRAAFCRRS
jgi:hypothetical protein